MNLCCYEFMIFYAKEDNGKPNKYKNEIRIKEKKNVEGVWDLPAKWQSQNIPI